MRTFDDPQHTTELTFAPVRRSELLEDSNLVQSAGLASKGLYLYPSVVTIDGGAKDTFKNAVLILEALRAQKPLGSAVELSRSFAPTTAKINNGTASQTPPKGTLLEAACTIITTLTPLKPAGWQKSGSSDSILNTAIIPDLELPDLLQFIGLFNAMQVGDVGSQLMIATLPAKQPPKESTQVKPAKAKKAVVTTSEYKRPRLHAGNYPFAPQNSDAFGTIGLLGAIGRWAHRARETEWAARVLNSLADAPLYIVSYDKIQQVHFGHHVTRLALEHELSSLLASLYRDTVLYREPDVQRRYDNPTYQLFYFTAARFLQLFSRPAFIDFLAFRAEYAPELAPLFNEYFMNIDSEIVRSAGALGRWLNTTAYLVARDDVGTGVANQEELVKKAKAKILVEFESAAMSAKSPQDLLFRISTRAGRLLQDDAPAAAERFMDATATGEISQQDATHLLVAYMRLRSKAKAKNVAETPAETEPVSISDLPNN
ncbi:hypothetical protein GCM10022408_00040 [Hymenobacter fastidiosus]|uniref:Type I-PGING CRISPR-associated protein Cas8c/Csp2 n=2 Tax=Hymenobacter fastidiosus TaxID=486264 RepID=A0ABP7R8H6_9BACT